MGGKDNLLLIHHEGDKIEMTSELESWFLINEAIYFCNTGAWGVYFTPQRLHLITYNKLPSTPSLSLELAIFDKLNFEFKRC